MKLKGIELIGEYTIVYFTESFRIFDENDNEIYSENLNRFWIKRKFDEYNNKIYFENSDGYWVKREFDKNNNQIYYENSKGIIENNRLIKELTVEQIEKLLGCAIKIIK
ncbi:MAG: hypothetical protein KQ78_01787 [Candidatus Izimaplasma bacterium HR2]|nr:MAG: hypothetical protein KQ78_01787 [Candidatus Izimaplasma bacterium HR2]